MAMGNWKHVGLQRAEVFSVLHQIFFKLGSFPVFLEGFRQPCDALCTCCQLVWVVMNPHVSPGMPRWIDLSGGPSARLHRSAGGRSHAASKRCTTGRGALGSQLGLNDGGLGLQLLAIFMEKIGFGF